MDTSDTSNMQYERARKALSKMEKTERGSSFESDPEKNLFIASRELDVKNKVTRRKWRPWLAFIFLFFALTWLVGGQLFLFLHLFGVVPLKDSLLPSGVLISLIVSQTLLVGGILISVLRWFFQAEKRKEENNPSAASAAERLTAALSPATDAGLP